jgi:hypothetical protein
MAPAAETARGAGRFTMSGKTLRTVRKDLTILTSLALLGLVALSALTGMGMDDEVEGFLPVDDVHPLIGYTMALVAGLHALLQLGAMRTYARKRWRDLAGAPPLRNKANQSASDEVTT